MIRPLLLAAALSVALAAPAMADLQSDVLSDLRASGVPNPTVTLSAPVGLETQLRGSDPVVPVLRVTYSPPASPPLAGLLAGTNGVFEYRATTGEEIVWDLAVYEAVKHALARGNRLSGLEAKILRPNELAETELFAVPPGPPPAQAPPTLSLAQVKSEIEQVLPADIAAEVTVQVTEDFVRERVVQASMTVPGPLFPQFNVHEIIQAMGQKQLALTGSGGNIGRVILRVRDSLSGELLYVGGHDMVGGRLSQWYHPLVRAWSRPLRRVVPPPPEELVDDTVKQAQDDANAVLGAGLP